MKIKRTEKPTRSGDDRFWFRVPSHIKEPKGEYVEHTYYEQIGFVDGIGFCNMEPSANALSARSFVPIINPAEVVEEDIEEAAPVVVQEPAQAVIEEPPAVEPEHVDETAKIANTASATVNKAVDRLRERMKRKK